MSIFRTRIALLTGVGLLAGVAGGNPPATGVADPLDARLHAHVTKLATDIGPRTHADAAATNGTLDYLVAQLKEMGSEPTREAYAVDGREAVNLVAERKGTTRADEVVVLGAHYDCVGVTPGADDNASGVAGLVESARALRSAPPSARTVRFVFFANEEPPFFQGASMGSLVYARACRERGDKVVAMIAYEMLGYYSDQPDSQHFPPPLQGRYPTTGNFIALVANVANKDLVERCHAGFAKASDLPVEVAALPEAIRGVSFSDHWSFWQAGFPAVMATDTAMFRNPHYHRATDTPDTLDYARMAMAVNGLVGAARALADPE